MKRKSSLSEEKDARIEFEKKIDSLYEIAFEEAVKGYNEGGIPVGSILVHKPTGKILGKGYNHRIQKGSNILHGEMDCL